MDENKKKSGQGKILDSKKNVIYEGEFLNGLFHG
jgi:hypothetical protein